LLSRYEAYGFSGVVLVAKDGRVVLHEGYGMADRERGLRNRRETLFEIGSLTKTFTAAAILQLEARGKLRTEDPLSRHLGPFPASKAAATIHHLATHTAGLLPEGYDLPYDDDRERFVQAMKDAPRESAPGEKYRYTNAGYSLLAAIVERVSGISYEAYVRKELFEAARLADSGFRPDSAPRMARLARGYLGSPAETKLDPAAPYPWGTRGAGGIVATVEDVYRWYLALQTDRVLPASARKKMFHPWPDEGYGWHVTKDEKGRRRIDKGGGMPAYASHLLHYPDQRLIVVWASNDLTQRWRRSLNRAIPAAALGDQHPIPPPILPKGAFGLAGYAGRYETESGKAVELLAGDRHLFARESDLGVSTAMPFFAESPTRFVGFDPQSGEVSHLRFELAPNGEVRSVAVSSPAGDVIAVRSRKTLG
jgi:CubicO group peptidase (beta-lactamase class C family)